MVTRPPLVTDGVTPWPRDFADRYRRAGYWQGRSIASHLADQVTRQPTRIAVVDGPERLTYQQLWDRSGSCARFLLDHAVAPGDRVVLQMTNSWQFVAVTLACFRTGIVPVMALPAHGRHEIAHLASLSGAVALVVSAGPGPHDARSVARQVAGEVPSVRAIVIHDGGTRQAEADTACRVPEYRLADAMTAAGPPVDDRLTPIGADVACLLVSGGTTGLPKLIVRTHDDYAYNVLCCSTVAGFSSDTVYLVAIPASHNFPLACPGLLGALFHGGRVVMLPSPSPERALRTIDAEGVTATAVVPAVAHAWIEHQREHAVMTGHSLRVLEVGGSRMPNELAARVRPVLGATLQQVFGMAEGLINMTRLDDPDEVICGTQGRPVSDADEIRILDEEGRPVPDGTPGLFFTRGPYTPRGYYHAPEHNERAFTPDGWYASGDIVVRRPDGNLVVFGRDKDMINRGGEKISAEEVENFAYQVDGVDTAAAVAMPDPVLGERLCLYLQVAPGRRVCLEDVAAVMERAGAARYKIPERLVIVDRLPATKVGKIDKKALRDDIRARLARERDRTQA